MPESCEALSFVLSYDNTVVFLVMKSAKKLKLTMDASRTNCEDAERGNEGGDDIVHLSVGGTSFVTLRSTLTAIPDSMLAKKFQKDSPFQAPLTDDQGRIFIDRDPETFYYILEYLRNNCRFLVQPPSYLRAALSADAEYFGLAALSSDIQKCDGSYKTYLSSVSRSQVLRKNQSNKPLSGIPGRPVAFANLYDDVYLMSVEETARSSNKY